MKKILNVKQIQEADAYTISHLPISSIDLMEKAAKGFVKRFTKLYSDNHAVKVFCGPGNNGGDGLAIARLLQKKRYTVDVYILNENFSFSKDFLANEDRLLKSRKFILHYLSEEGSFPSIGHHEIIIDALWGSGLTRPVKGLGEKLIAYINKFKKTTVSVDIPSGLFADKTSGSATIHADLTISFQTPKLSFLFPENAESVSNWELADIGLSKDYLNSANCSDYYTEEKDIRKIIHPRKKFDHKGKFGSALIVSGSAGKIGAAVLCCGACLKTGAGLTTAHLPRIGNAIMQAAIPDVMVKLDDHENIITRVEYTDNYTTIGIGPGIGTEKLTQDAFLNLLNKFRKPMVIDADALNILSLNKSWLQFVPEGCILTPHPKEFERLFGPTKDSFERLALQRKKSAKHKVVIVLKGAHTCITSPEQMAWFNSTGNPGMAKGGSGDVLTGIITALLAQGYTPEQSAIAGVYLHGLAGNIAVKKETNFNLTASELVNHISDAFKKILE